MSEHRVLLVEHPAYLSIDLGRLRIRREGKEDAFAQPCSLIARELAMVGLNPALGLGHDSAENPFNLADDFIEPYRRWVEKRVFAIVDKHKDFDGLCRLDLLAFMREEVEMNRQHYRLPAAVAETVASYCRILEKGHGRLSLPGMG